jgi:hypothetical protein
VSRTADDLLDELSEVIVTVAVAMGGITETSFLATVMLDRHQ